MEPAHPRRIVLADDHDEVLQTVRLLLAPRFEVADVVRDGAALVAAARDCKPDAVVSDLQMPLMSGMEACRRILREQSCTAAILLTIYAEELLLEEAHQAGIRGVVLKADAGEELIAAIDAVIAGGAYISTGLRNPSL